MDGASPPWKIIAPGCIPLQSVVAIPIMGTSTKPTMPTTAAKVAPRDSSVARERTMK